MLVWHERSLHDWNLLAARYFYHQSVALQRKTLGYHAPSNQTLIEAISLYEKLVLRLAVLLNQDLHVSSTIYEIQFMSGFSLVLFALSLQVINTASHRHDRVNAVDLVL